MPRVSRLVRRTIVELFLMRIGLIATYQRQIRDAASSSRFDKDLSGLTPRSSYITFPILVTYARVSHCEFRIRERDLIEEEKMKRSREKEVDGKAMAQFVLRDIFFRRSSLEEFRSVDFIYAQSTYRVRYQRR